jgi:hypothetical protein
MKFGYGTEEWVTYILITLSNSSKEKLSEKCPRSQNQPTLYASIVNKEENKNQVQIKGIFNDKTTRNCAH